MVKDHLKRCPPCREEYEALYKALEMMAEKSTEDSE
jgi:predicted anti-sigma-YlaC factor YlaD